MSEVGSPLLTHRQITTLLGEIIAVELLRGLHRVTRLRIGKRLVPCCSSMVNVRDTLTCLVEPTDDHSRGDIVVGSGKSILWLVPCQFLSFSTFISSTSSAIIQELKAIYDAGLALMAYHYCDFRDTAKQDVRGLLTSLLSQLGAKSDPCYELLSDLYSRHNAGSQQPDDHALMECLKDMLELPGQPSSYIIVDAVDECPNTSGVVSPRERVLELVEELVELRLPNLHICITGRPEADVVAALEPLASHQVSLHDESGQKKDISDYVSSVVHSDRRMRKWRVEDKELVIDILARKADGM